MPEAKTGKAEPLIPCPNCGCQGQVRRTGQFLQCSGHYLEIPAKQPFWSAHKQWVNAGCGYGDLEHKFTKGGLI